jgi:L-ascorbate metabolism protein UlaG (beta-lactamase superfamily)
LTKKYADTDKPHIRMTEMVINPNQLDFIDVATSSHNHTDHLDAETLIPLMSVNPKLKIVVPEANRDFAADRLQVDAESLIGSDAGKSVTIADIEINGVPAAHETLEINADGQHKFLGYVFQFGEWTIYHSGDTMLYGGMVIQFKRWEIDLAILPINGSDPSRRVSGNLSGSQAVWLAQQIGAKLVIPCHYEMFEFNTVSPDQFVAEAKKQGQNYCLLKCGERFSSTGNEFSNSRNDGGEN